MRVILVADNASIDFGGEAALPCHYFRVLLSRKIDVHLVVHERSKKFIDAYFQDVDERVHYTKDNKMHRLLHFFQSKIPARIGHLIFGLSLYLLTQIHQKSVVRSLVVGGKTIVHQVIPVSPKAPSMMFGLNAPVIFGPLNGGMRYPDAFTGYEGAFSALNAVGRYFSGMFNYLLPGKLQARLLLVSNKRTEEALPAGVQGEVRYLVENGVDLSIWQDPKIKQLDKNLTRFVFVGRLIPFKAVDILLEAFIKAVQKNHSLELHIIGDGDKRMMLEKIVADNKLSKQVFFHGWVPQSKVAEIIHSSQALVMPSLWDCGGAVVLEAMACSTPVIATNWGGPPDYLDESCGFLINPDSRLSLVDGFSHAMLSLAEAPDLAQEMGRSGRKKIEQEYDWEKKVDKIVEMYRQLL